MDYVIPNDVLNKKPSLRWVLIMLLSIAKCRVLLIKLPKVSTHFSRYEILTTISKMAIAPAALRCVTNKSFSKQSPLIYLLKKIRLICMLFSHVPLLVEFNSIYYYFSIYIWCVILTTCN